MSQLPAFRQLQNFIGENTARKHSRKGPKPETANGLTKRLISFLRNRGHFAARINTTGLYDEKLGKYRPSGATTSVPDVISCVEGYFVGLEIKIGADRMSQKQQQIALQINSAGGFYLVVRSFDDFEKFYAELTTPAFLMNYLDSADLIYGLWLCHDAGLLTLYYHKKRADATTHQPA